MITQTEEILLFKTENFLMLGNTSKTVKFSIEGDNTVDIAIGDEYTLFFLLPPRELFGQEKVDVEKKIIEGKYEEIKFPFSYQRIKIENPVP